MNIWCDNVNTGTPSVQTASTDGDAGNAKSPTKKCAPSTWNVKLVGDMSSLLGGTACVDADWGKLNAAGVSYDDMNSWDVSGATDMKELFSGAAKFNLPLNGWNVAKVTDMESMFKNAAVFDQDLNAWDVVSATKLTSMFKGAAVFNQSLNSWNVAKVTDMSGLFSGAKLFSKEIGSWNTAKVTKMNLMFKDADLFAQNINDWDVSKVTSMKNMFQNTAIFPVLSESQFNAPLNAWNVAKVTDAAGMFDGAALFNQDLRAWDVGTNDAVNVAGVAADYGIVSGVVAKYALMFKGTGMSDCNKKIIHNKMEALPADPVVDFDGATQDAAGTGQDWSYPNLVCP